MPAARNNAPPTSFLSAMVQDLRFAARFFLRNRGLSLAAILTLGLGIGSTTALFSVAQAVLLDQLPVRNPDQLVLCRFIGDPELSIGITSGWNLETAEGLRSSTALPYPAFLHLRNEQTKLESLFAFAGTSRLTLLRQGKTETGRGQLVSGDYFQGLGLQPAAGRLIDAGDDSTDAPPVVVLSHLCWMSRFGGDPAIVGQDLRINQKLYTIAGVAPYGFRGTLQLGSNPEFFFPIAFMGDLHRLGEKARNLDTWWLQIMGRLQPENSRVEAEAQLNLLFQQAVRPVIEERNADQDLSKLFFPTLQLMDGGQGQYEVRQRLGDTIQVAAILVVLVLFLAGVNAAALLTAKATRRRQEMAVRLSLGASRWRLVRQLGTEAVLLALLAGGAGLVIAFWGKDLMAGMVAARNSLGTGLEVSISLPVLFFALGISFFTGIVFGILPALKTSSIDPAPALKETARSMTLSRSSRLLSRSLSVVQVALAVVVLVSAGLLLSTLANLLSVDPGFDPDNLLAFEVDPNSAGYNPQQRLEFYEQLRQGLAALPALRSVSYSSQPLVGGSSSSLPFLIRGETASTSLNYAGPSFFETLGIPILAGRDFDQRDSRSMPTAIVSHALAEKHFAGQSPLGETIEVAINPDLASFFPGLDQKFEIVGVAGDTKYADLREEPRPTVFLPARQNGEWMRSAHLYARLVAAPEKVIPEIEKTLQDLDRNLPMTDVRMYPARIRDSMDQERQFAQVTSFFGGVALLLVAIGLYGTLSHAVACRSKEFGVRQALGANPGRIVRLVMRELVVVLIGLGIGIASCIAVTDVLSSLVFGLEPRDPLTIVLASLLLTAVASLAVYIPARRASRVDPVTALRFE